MKNIIQSFIYTILFIAVISVPVLLLCHYYFLYILGLLVIYMLFLVWYLIYRYIKLFKDKNEETQ